MEKLGLSGLVDGRDGGPGRPQKRTQKLRKQILSLYRKGLTAVIVEDSGPGISQQDLPHVFERFYQSCEPLTGARKGMGLGLAIARELTLARGGE